MHLALLLAFGFPISISDFYRHIIPNRVLIAFAGALCALLLVNQTLGPHLAFAVKALVSLALFQWITAGVMGMGDVKYLVLLALLVGSGPLYFRGLFFSAVGAGLISVAYFLIERSLNIDIPLAPAFTLGFTLAIAL